LSAAAIAAAMTALSNPVLRQMCAQSPMSVSAMAPKNNVDAVAIVGCVSLRIAPKSEAS
jgi:hypothetical protein